MIKQKFRIGQVPPGFQKTWATVEWFHWNQEVNDILKRDIDDALFMAAYDSVDWESYYERLRGTPFYDWAVEGGTRPCPLNARSAGRSICSGPGHVRLFGAAQPPLEVQTSRRTYQRLGRIRGGWCT